MSAHAHLRFDANELPIVNVFGLYDSDDSGRRVKALLEHLANGLGEDFQFATRLWGFDVLERIRSGDQAHADAAVADIMIVALGTDVRLQIGLTEWLEEWAARRKVADAALAVSLTESSPVPLPVMEHCLVWRSVTAWRCCYRAMQSPITCGKHCRNAPISRKTNYSIHSPLIRRTKTGGMTIGELTNK